MVNCAVFNCPNRTCRDRADHKKGVRFFLIPTVIKNQDDLTRRRTERRRATWLARINRKDLQDGDVRVHHRVCSHHFVSGTPAKLWEETNPDWAPSLELGYASPSSANDLASARYARAKQRCYSRSVKSTQSTAPAVVPSEGRAVDSNEQLEDREPEEMMVVNEVPPSENAVDIINQETQFSNDVPALVKANNILNLETTSDNASLASVSDDMLKLPALARELDDCKTELATREKRICDLWKQYEEQQKECEKMQQLYNESRKFARKLRDDLTEREVDKFELQQSVKSAEAELDRIKQQLKEQQELFEMKLKMSEDKIEKACEKVRQDSLMKSKKLQEELMQVEKLTFRSLDSFASDERKVKFYTGLPSFSVFEVVLNGVVKFLVAQKVDLSRYVLEPWQSLLATLMKLRLSLPYQDLSYRFGVSITTIGRTFDLWIDALYKSVYPAIVTWPDRETLWETMPREFREQYGNSVAVIIDCFEIFVDKPSSLDTRASVWSNYKHHHTVKVLIGISPIGAIIFVSVAWGARASDQQVVKESGLYELLLPHDVVMADRGFKIAEHLATYGAKLLIPASTRGQDQLSAHDISLTRKIANLRIHVERVIGLVRNKYRILKGILPTTMLMKKAGDEVALIDKVVRVCCALVNLCPSIVVHPQIHEEMSDCDDENGSGDEM